MLRSGRVVCFARLDAGAQRTGKTRHLVDGREPDAHRGLAITEEPGGAAYYLVYCDRDWNAVTDTWHRTLDDAKAQAEFEYEGVCQAWEVLPAEA
jgi:hypothetical protein